MNNWAIIVAAGKSVRFGHKLPKQFHLVAGKPLLAWSIAAFEKAHKIDQIIVVTSEEYQKLATKDVIETHKFKKVAKIVGGGRSRRESVYNALKALPSSTKTVAIHDGVRPLVEPEDIDKVIEAAHKFRAAILAVPVRDTVKEVDGNAIVKTLQRDKIWLAQTPQAFDYKVIFEAHQESADKDNSEDVIDDAILVERKGIMVKVIEASSANIKVTALEDLAIVEIILRKRIYD